jgi:hypothetical protein
MVWQGDTGAAMKTDSCRRLYEYWNQRRGSRAAPERGELEPGSIRQLLADSFVVAIDAATGHPLRLAGTRVCALFCREIKGVPFGGLFAPDCRAEIRDLVEIVAHELTPVVAGVVGRPGHELPPVDLELLLLPLYHRGRSDARLLGMLAPLTVPYWIGTHAVAGLSLGPLRHLRVVAAPALAPDRMPEVVRRNWTVLDGGRR